MTSVRDPTRWRPKKKPSLGNGRCAKDRFPECHRCRRFAWSPTPGQTSHWQTLVSNVFGLPRPCGSTHADNSSSRSTPKLSSAASARYSRTRRVIGVHIHQNCDIFCAAERWATYLGTIAPPIWYRTMSIQRGWIAASTRHRSGRRQQRHRRDVRSCARWLWGRLAGVPSDADESRISGFGHRDGPAAFTARAGAFFISPAECPWTS